MQSVYNLQENNWVEFEGIIYIMIYSIVIYFGEQQ